jgi:hypothetical protein
MTVRATRGDRAHESYPEQKDPQQRVHPADARIEKVPQKDLEGSQYNHRAQEQGKENVLEPVKPPQHPA